MSNLNERKIAEDNFYEAYDSLIGNEEPNKLPGMILKGIACSLISVCVLHSMYAFWADNTGVNDVFRNKSTPFVIVTPTQEEYKNSKLGAEQRKSFFDPSQASLTPARIFDDY